ESTYYGSTSWNFIQKWQDKQKLQTIINHKRKFNRYFNWNEEHEIDWKKLTYISIHADFTTLGVLRSPNGKPLNENEVNEYIQQILKTKLYNYALKISKEEKSNDKYNNHIDYWLSVSNDKTKNKRLHSEKIY